MIRLYDSSVREVVPLQAREGGRVGMYVCGPTVYNYVHIGNARTVVWFDFIRRYLVYRGLDVTYVMNYTDVDDKIIERASLEGISPEEVTRKYAAAFERDILALGASDPDILPRATDHIDDMVKAVGGLIEKGSAYEANGDVFFSIESFPGYGKLSRRSGDDMRAGERVDPHPAKRHPLDFALWKAAKEGEPSWPSPWGPGRPGWHIECSVMSTKYLGMGFEIHGGGADLIFPHHENEVAQAEALAGEEPFVRHWLHAGLVQMEAEKMSKSLGNVVLAKDAIARFSGRVVRYWILSASYRTQATFSEGSLNDAAQACERWSNFYSAAQHALGDRMPTATSGFRRALDAPVPDSPAGPFLTRFLEALDDDFNSPEAFAAVHDLVREGNGLLEAVQMGSPEETHALAEITAVFLELTSVLGVEFLTQEPSSDLVRELIAYLLDLREDARREKAFARADAIRDRLSELGVVIEDTPAGPRWRAGGDAG